MSGVRRHTVRFDHEVSGVSTRVIKVLDSIGASDSKNQNANALTFKELKRIESGRRAILLRVSFLYMII
jgi:hypothetical protein